MFGLYTSIINIMLIYHYLLDCDLVLYVSVKMLDY